MQDNKRTHDGAGQLSGTTNGPDSDTEVEELHLPPHAPTKGRKIDEPKPIVRRKNGEDPADGPEGDDDRTGEMASAGQDLGLPVAEDEATRDHGQFD